MGSSGDHSYRNRKEVILIPEVIPIDEFDADLAAAVRIRTGINHVGGRAITLILSRQNYRLACLDRMAADESGTVAAQRGSPGIFLPGLARIFSAQPDRHCGR
jgi:hypothetical protein